MRETSEHITQELRGDRHDDVSLLPVRVDPAREFCRRRFSQRRPLRQRRLSHHHRVRRQPDACRLWRRTTFNFGEHVILTAAASGFTIATYAWTVEGPTIKDYNEDLGTQESPAPPPATPWSTTPLAAADLPAASVGFYWVPTAAQFEPNNGPFSRNVSLTVTKNGGGDCTVKRHLYGRAQRGRHYASGRGLLHFEPPLDGDDQSGLWPRRRRAHLLTIR